MSKRGDFTEQAEAYSRSRPTYPFQLIDELMGDAAVAAGDHVADVGAGTGILTRQLIERGLVVSAVEPNAEMRRRADCPTAVWNDGSFEDTKLPDGSQRWVIAAQSLHWADPKRALPELKRILQPRRLFTALWNVKMMDANPTLAWTAAAIERIAPSFRDAYDEQDWPAVMESTGDFEYVGRRVVRHSQFLTPARFVEYWKSHHWLQQSSSPELFAAFVDELRLYLEGKNIKAVNVVYDSFAYNARRMD